MSPATTLENTLAHPWAKSAGGKRKMLPAILQTIKEMPAWDSSTGTYHEPFVGGGALFFELRNMRMEFAHWRLADANKPLVTTYKVIRDDVESLIGRLMNSGYENTQDGFTGVRDEFNRLVTSIPETRSKLKQVIAANFVYLNRVCFNGLWRVNGDGRFNVPFGRYTNPTICDAVNLRACSKALDGVKLFATDFAKTPVREGDFVFADSPYIPASGTSDFTGYTAGGFPMEKHIELRNNAVAWKKVGANVLLCNSDTATTRELYKGWNLREVSMTRSINAKGGKRGAVGELLIW